MRGLNGTIAIGSGIGRAIAPRLGSGALRDLRNARYLIAEREKST